MLSYIFGFVVAALIYIWLASWILNKISKLFERRKIDKLSRDENGNFRVGTYEGHKEFLKKHGFSED